LKQETPKDFPLQLQKGTKINQSFYGATFVMTFEGKLIKYDLTHISYQRLLKIVEDCLAAFAAVGSMVELQNAAMSK
jgi:hypothetical protein